MVVNGYIFCVMPPTPHPPPSPLFSLIFSVALICLVLYLKNNNFIDSLYTVLSCFIKQRSLVLFIYILTVFVAIKDIIFVFCDINISLDSPS